MECPAMGEIQSFRDLVVWQRSVDLGVWLYQLTAQFPEAERFGLSQQLRRAGVSVSSNIAGGYGRGSANDYLRFLRNSRGSLNEIETQLVYAERLGSAFRIASTRLGQS
jgi:four helix bundle protein